MSNAGRRRVFLSLGSNLGDRAAWLDAAREAIEALPGTRLVATSRVYETAPQERQDQPSYLNQVVAIDTALEPIDLLHECQRIEYEHGRRRAERFSSRRGMPAIDVAGLAEETSRIQSVQVHDVPEA
jgi:2-amino-4-hydroxy-6-hydroxymethyldihydropteridine diphosphokinase